MNYFIQKKKKLFVSIPIKLNPSIVDGGTKKAMQIVDIAKILTYRRFAPERRFLFYDQFRGLTEDNRQGNVQLLHKTFLSFRVWLDRGFISPALNQDSGEFIWRVRKGRSAETDHLLTCTVETVQSLRSPELHCKTVLFVLRSRKFAEKRTVQ